MKTLKKFECANCIIKISMQTTKEIVKDYKAKLYKMTTTPKHKNTWKEYSTEFNYSEEANNCFLNETKFLLI